MLAADDVSSPGQQLALAWQRQAAGAQLQDRQYSAAVLANLAGLPVPTSAGHIAQLGRHEYA